MAEIRRLTVDEAIKKYNEKSKMRHKTYDTQEYAPRKMMEILESELSKGRVGNILALEYRDDYAKRTFETTVIKVSTQDEWEHLGNLYNRKKGSMYGSYGNIREAYNNLIYTLQNSKCFNLHVYYV